MRSRPVALFAYLNRRGGLRRAIASLMATSLILNSCSTSGSPTAPKGTVTSVAIGGTLPDNVLIVGKNVQLSATPKDASGNALADRPITWTSSNAAAATVSATGLVTANTAGSSTISASADGISASVLMSLRVEIVPPPAGGQTTTTPVLGGQVSLTIPPGAVPAGVNLNVGPAVTPSGDAGLVEAFDFGPSGTQFTTPITITLKYDKSLITTPYDRAGLAIYLAQASTWTRVAGSTVDTIAGTVSASVSHFSTYSILRPGAPAAIVVQAGIGQSAVAGSSVAVAPSVLVSDARGEPEAGVGVTFAVTGGGGSVTGASQTTDAHGIATVGSWTLGPAGGVNTLSATVSGLSPATFTATGSAPTLTLTPSSLSFSAVAGGTPPAGQTVSLTTTSAPVSGIALGTITYSGSATGWLSASLSGSTTPATVTLVASVPLAAGTYTAQVPVTATGITPQAISVTFAVSAQAATQLAITAQPSASASSGAPFGAQPVVEVRDAGGVKVAGATNAVTASILSGSGTLAGTTTVNAVNGAATFTNLQINGSGAHTLSFTATGLTSATSSTVTVTQTVTHTATQLVITTQPAGASSGTVFGTQPVVEVRDASGTKVAGVTIAVTAAIAKGTGVLVGTTTVNAVNGVVTFTDLKINGVGSSSLRFTATELTPATSISFAVTQVPTQLALVTAPSATAASGVVLATQPVVEVRDVGGTKVAGSTVNVTAAIASGTATLGGTTTVAAVNGTATFTNLQLTGATGSVTLTFTSSGLTAATSGTIALTQTASQLAITTQPAGASSGTVFGTQPVVEVRDVSGTKVAGATIAVTAAIATGSGTLVGTTTVNAVNGVVTFTDLKINGVGSSSLSFTATGLTPATSISFAVTQAPTQLALVTAPSATAASGVVLATQPVVEVRDVGGTKVAGSTVNVTAAIASGTATLGGTTTIAAVNGTATFTNLKFTGATGSVTLTFTSSGLTAATSGTIALTQTASQLAITTQPSGASSGTVFGTQPVVEVRDVSGTKVAGATIAVTAAIATGSGTLVGTTTVNAVNGVVTFTDLKINGVGTSSLSFTATGLTSATSASFAVTQVPTQLALVTAPSATAASGVVLATQPVVEVRDVGGTKVAGSTVNVTAAIASGTATLGGTTTVAAVNGTATFTNLKLTGATGSVTLTFTSTGLTAATSGTIALTQTASQLAITTQPSATASSGAPFATQPVVAIRDPGNLLVATSSAAVTAAIASGTGTLAGTTTVNAVNGVATFTNLQINGSEAHTLSFTATGLTAATSITVTVTQAATQLAITTQPSASASSGSAFGTQPVVEIRDGSGTKVLGATNAVTAAIATGTGTLAGTTTVNAVNGVATFTNLKINGSGAHTLSFTATGLTSATSSTVTVTQTATQVAITTQPSANASSGTVFGTQPVVEIRDGSDTKVAGATNAVTAAIASGTGTLVGTTTVNAVNGVATFTNLQINGAAGSFTLRFSATGLTAATSSTIALTQTATQLAITTQPSGAATGTVFVTQPVIEIRDAGGAKVATATTAVTAAVASGPGTLSGTLTVNAVGGVATFTDLRITGAGTSSLTFTATGLTSATSGTFTVSPPVITLDVGASASTPGTNGQNLTIPLILDLTQAGGQNIASFTTTVTWDPTKFNYVSVSAGTSGWAAVPNTSNTASGTLSLSMFDAIGLSSGTTTMYNVTLVPKASGTTSVTAGVSAAGADIGTNILSYMATRSLTVVVP